MKKKRCEYQFAIPDFIHNDTTDDDAEAEAGESGTGYFAQLLGRETKLGTPSCEDAASNTKANTCCEDGHETSPQEPIGIYSVCTMFVIHCVLYFI